MVSSTAQFLVAVLCVRASANETKKHGSLYMEQISSLLRGPGQYRGGGPPGKPLGCCALFVFVHVFESSVQASVSQTCKDGKKDFQS